LGRWRLTVRNKWPAVPELHTTMTLAELRPHLTISEKHADLPLSLPSLLEESPRGNFAVRLRGPLGRDAEFTLRLLPHLQIMGHETLYLPRRPDGPQPVELLVETMSGDGLECQSQEQENECRILSVERRQDNWMYEVQVAPDVTRAELTVVHPLPSGDSVRVPVPISIRRLRWALVGEREGPSRKAWTGRVIEHPVDALLQLRSPFLLVRLPLCEGKQARLGLCLSDVDNVELQVTDLASLPRGRQLYRFDLAAFLDTIRASQSPILRLELVVRDLPGRHGSLRLPILSLTQTLVVEDVALEIHRVDDHADLALRWHEPAPLKNRRVRFWPLWRPWEHLVEKPIPDDAEGELSCQVLADEMRPGKYRVEFLVVDPWVTSAIPETPSEESPCTADIELISPDAQLQVLDARLQNEGRCFDILLERAFVCYDAGVPQKARSDWQWCFEHLDEGSIPQILALVGLVQAAGDPATQMALRLKMFAAGRIERLRRARSQGEVSPAHFRRYLVNLPRSSLLPQNTCQQLLLVEDETARLYAVQQLIRRGEVLGLNTVLEWIEGATLSDADAIALLALNPNLAIERLQEGADDLTARRLLDGLNRAVPPEEIVRVGEWVHCDVGWGRIERIENPHTHAEIEWIAGKRSHYQLHVTLRPDVSPEPIIIDLASASVRFLEPDRVFACTKCEGFSTQRKDDLRLHFQEAHPTRSKKEAGHGTIRFRFEDQPISLQLLEVAPEEPHNQLL